QDETVMYPDTETLEGGNMKTMLGRTGPDAGWPARDILLVALAVVTVVAVIAAGAADAFLHGDNQATPARVAAAGTGTPPPVAEASGGTPVTDSRILPATSSPAAVAPAGADTVAARPHAGARRLATMPMTMPQVPAAEPVG